MHLALAIGFFIRLHFDVCFLGLVLAPRRMGYVERIVVVARGPMHAFVVVCVPVKCIVLSVVAAIVCVNCAYVFLIFVVDKPSLQAFRAETMVERFTARMHVALGPGRRSGSDDEQKIQEKNHVLLDCSGSARSFAISARQFVP